MVQLPGWFKNRRKRSSRRHFSRPNLLRVQLLEDRCVPATFTVNSTADTGSGTLRNQIIAANANPGVDIIEFDASAFTSAKTITLTSEIAITGSVTVNGPSAALTISGNSVGRIFNINDAVTGTAIVAVLNNLTLTKGVTAGVADGAAIFIQDEDVTLNNCTLTANSSSSDAGAIRVEASGGKLLVFQSTLSSNTASVSGGAISALANTSVTIRESTLKSNIGLSGGGLSMLGGGTIIVERSTLSNNTATSGDGGGLALNNSFTGSAINNATFSGNSASSDGGAIVFSNASIGTFFIRNCTFGSNNAGAEGGGIARTGGTATITLISSIVFGNNAGTTADNLFSAGTVNATLCIIGTSTGVTTFNGDTFTDANIGVNPGLGGLASNGGPTQTRSISLGSIAVDAGTNPLGLTTDQRGAGYFRVRGSAIDIGAFEVPQDFTVTAISNSGAGSLRQAVLDANNAIGIDTIVFDAAVFNAAKTITLTSGELLVTEAVTIDGPTASLTVSGNNFSRVFHAENASAVATLTINDMTITAGNVTGSDDGGAIYSTENLLLTNVTVSNSIAGDEGGGIRVAGSGSFTMTNCTISGNTAVTGGGIAQDPGFSSSHKGGSIFNNVATGSGGGIALLGATSLSLTHFTISGNTAATGGGIAWITSGNNNTINNSTITGNTATGGKGGGAYVFAGTTNFTSTIVSGNNGGSGPDIFSIGTTNVNFSAVGSNTGFTLTGANNLATGTNLLLGPLQDNGSNLLTHLPGVNSPVVSKGSNPTGAANDQRGSGFPRSRGGSVDIGAVEVGQFIVTNTNASGAGSLLQATIDANAAEGADTITFDPTVFSTLQSIIPTSEMVLTENTDIIGPAGQVTISGNAAHRIFRTTSGTAFNFVNLRMIFGVSTSGAALQMDGTAATATLDNCLLNFNSSSGGGGAIQIGSGDSLTLTDSTLQSNTAPIGGAIQAASSAVSITRSTLANNKSTGITSGGAGIAFISAPASLLIVDSTISNNSSAANGGGIFLTSNSTAAGYIIRNSTITSNTADGFGGGIAWSNLSGSMTVQNSTITLNSSNAAAGGGGISVMNVGSTTLNLESTIVSGNINAGAPDIDNPNTTNQKTSAVGSNLGYAKTDLGGNLPFGASLLLGPLGSNGGATMTHLPLAGSPLINAGSNPAGLTLDQRGINRASSGGVDIGSAERFDAVVRTIADSGADSLRGVLETASYLQGGSAVTFDATVFATAQTITLTSGEIVIVDDTEIIGPAVGVTVSGNNTSRIFSVSGSSFTILTISNMTMTNGKGLMGGAIFANGVTLDLDNCKFSSNTATSVAGGAIAVINDGGVDAANCVFQNNFASGVGGAIAILGSDDSGGIILTESVLSGNSSGTSGGAVYAESLIRITSCSVTGNSATSGGAFHFNEAYVEVLTPAYITNSTIANNSSSGDGGAVFLTNLESGDSFAIVNSTLTGNSSGNKGGAIANSSSGGTLYIASSILFGNMATVSASEILSTPTVTMEASLLANASGIGTFAPDSFTSSKIGFNPMLGALQNNGGLGLSLLPAITSPALNAGLTTAFLPTTDQRGTGFPRIRGTGIDIGAVEVPVLNVINTNDSGTGSLRQAVLDANAVQGSDTIVFDPTVFATAKTITLTTATLNVSEALTIVGPAAGVTVNGNNAFRIFTQNNDNDFPIALSSMTLTAGKPASGNGGAFLIEGADLTLTNVTISNCSAANAGAIQLNDPGAVLVANNCVFQSNTASSSGGAIASNTGGSLTLLNSTFSGNTAGGNGGAFISVGSTLLLEGSTLSGNKGAVSAFEINGNPSAGGAVIRNSTISGNTATGAFGAIRLFNVNTGITIQNCTITGNTASTNGAAILQSTGTGTIDLASTIVSGNVGAGTFDIRMISAATTKAANSAIGIAPSGGTFTDLGGNLAFGTNLKLAALANNGGQTLTHLPALDSPLINAGSNPASSSTDQRGFARVLSGQAEIGAVETFSTVVTNTNDAGPGSLRQVILDANAVPGADTITFDPAAFAIAKTITLTSGQLNLNEGVTITGPASIATVSGNLSSRVLEVSTAGGAVINISNLAIASGSLFGQSGAGMRILSADTVVLDAVSFLNNSGGGIAASAATDLTIRNSTFSGNISRSGTPGGGGLAMTSGGKLVVENSTFYNNNSQSTGGGGAMLLAGTFPSGAIVRNSTLSGNSTASTIPPFDLGSGGAIQMANFNGTFTLQNSTVANNSAKDFGGAIHAGNKNLVVESSIFTGNVASSSSNGNDIFTGGTVTANASLIGSKTGITTFTADSFTNANLGANPHLGALTSNGGPTQTHLPEANSLAVNHGSNPAGLTTDQRGFTRVVGGAIDIGAVESRTFLVTNTNDSGTGSLRQVLFDANGFAGADVVAFDPVVFSTSKIISVQTALPSILEPLTIQGTGSGLLTIRRDPTAVAKFNIFTIVSSASNAIINDVTLSEGESTGLGGGLNIASATVTINRSVITGNSAANTGGAIHINNGTLNIHDSTISGNTTGSFGGGISATSSSIAIERCTISGNSSSADGGGLDLSGPTGSVFVRNSTFSGNSATTGAGINTNSFSGFLVVHNSTIAFNSATSGNGGGLRIVNGNPTIEVRSTIISNNAGSVNKDIQSNKTFSLGHSLIGVGTGFTFTDLGGNLPFGLDPRLAPLADNGGFTQIHSLLNGSPAVNAGSNPDGLINDQRGQPRVIGTATDIGAFENQAMNFIVNEGAQQRSRITTIKINFANALNVSLLTNLGAITLTRTAATGIGTVGTIVQTGATGANGRITVSPASGMVTNVTLTIDNANGDDVTAGVEYGSLADGRWQLGIPALGFTSLVGDTDLRRLFGDADANGNINADDFAVFGNFFGATAVGNPFDFDNNTTINADDFAEFGNRFGLTL